MSHYYTRECAEHGEWAQDVDRPDEKCPQCPPSYKEPSMLAKLYSNGSIGADLSPGDPVSAWAYRRIQALESALNEITQKRPPGECRNELVYWIERRALQALALETK